MKRLFCFLVFLFLANISVSANAQSATFTGGDGSEANPFQITNWQHLNEIRNNLTSHFILMNNLDETTLGYAELASSTADEGAGWLPILMFAGSFDGQEFEIRNLFINRPATDNVGLFGYIWDGAVIENVGVVNGDVTGSTMVGGVVGFNDASTIANSYNSGSVTGGVVGGVVGMNNRGTVINSYNSGSVTGTGAVGGVVGSNSNATITNSYNSGSVAGTWAVGGLAGWNFNGTITGSYNIGSVVGNESVGGLAGESNYGSTIANSYNSGSVTGSGVRVGGVVGNNAGTITGSYNRGSVVGNESVGGVAGESHYEGTITNSYFLEGTAARGVGALAEGADDATSKTEAQFTSGEVARLLQGEQEDLAWGNTVLSDGEFPRLAFESPEVKQVFRISFESQEPIHQSVDYLLSGDLIDFPDLERTGHIVIWEDIGGDEYPVGSVIFSDLELIAQWTVNQYTITFDAAGGSAVAPITQDFGTAVIAPANPTRANHTFAGWSPSLPATMPAGGLTVTAQWTTETVVQIQNEPDFSVKLGPNPIKENLVITISDAGDYVGRVVRLSVYDSRGRAFRREEIVINGVFDEVEVDVSQLPAGVCFVVLEVEGLDAKRVTFAKVSD